MLRARCDQVSNLELHPRQQFSSPCQMSEVALDYSTWQLETSLVLAMIKFQALSFVLDIKFQITVICLKFSRFSTWQLETSLELTLIKFQALSFVLEAVFKTLSNVTSCFRFSNWQLETSLELAVIKFQTLSFVLDSSFQVAVKCHKLL